MISIVFQDPLKQQEWTVQLLLMKKSTSSSASPSLTDEFVLCVLTILKLGLCAFIVTSSFGVLFDKRNASHSQS